MESINFLWAFRLQLKNLICIQTKRGSEMGRDHNGCQRCAYLRNLVTSRAIILLCNYLVTECFTLFMKYHNLGQLRNPNHVKYFWRDLNWGSVVENTPDYDWEIWVQISARATCRSKISDGFLMKTYSKLAFCTI